MNSRLRRKARRSFSRAVKRMTGLMAKHFIRQADSMDRETPFMQWLRNNGRLDKKIK